MASSLPEKPPPQFHTRTRTPRWPPRRQAQGSDDEAVGEGEVPPPPRAAAPLPPAELLPCLRFWLPLVLGWGAVEAEVPLLLAAGPFPLPEVGAVAFPGLAAALLLLPCFTAVGLALRLLPCCCACLGWAVALPLCPFLGLGCCHSPSSFSSTGWLLVLPSACCWRSG